MIVAPDLFPQPDTFKVPNDSMFAAGILQAREAIEEGKQVSKKRQQCSELVMTGVHFQDHRCLIPATVFENDKWWCSRHSKAGLRRARNKARARRRN